MDGPCGHAMRRPLTEGSADARRRPGHRRLSAGSSGGLEVKLVSPGPLKATLRRERVRMAGVRILIFGTGVIGSVYGERLLAAGHDVVLLARGGRLRDLRESGLVLRNAQTG
jgi:Ketopantoate reductase PanE/ApbA